MRRLALLLLLAAGCGERPPTPTPADTPPPGATATAPRGPCTTPAQVHRRMQAAIRGGQRGALVSLHLPADRPLFLFNLVFVANLAAAARGGSQPLRAILKRHGVPDGGKAPEAVDARRPWARTWLEGVALAPLAADLMAFIGPRFDRPYSGPLVGLKIEGDRASGRIGKATHRFVRLDGAWYLSADQ